MHNVVKWPKHTLKILRCSHLLKRNYLKICKSQSNTEFAWDLVFENLDKYVEYVCDGVPTQ